MIMEGIMERKMERRVSGWRLISACLLACAVSSLSGMRLGAQTIDPTVEVTRDYAGRQIEVHKPLQSMPVPDSLQRFDIKFDYQVNDSPYGGTSDFSPLLLDIRPEPLQDERRRFYLKAGAGYALRPSLDFVWEPGLDGAFRMSVYGSHRSYFGRYLGIRPVYDASGTSAVLEDPSGRRYGSRASGGNASYSGYEMRTSAGVNGSLDWEGGTFSFDAGYRGLAARDTVMRRGYDMFDLSMRVRSDEAGDRRFFYDFSADYSYGEDKTGLSGAESRDFLSEHLFGLDASFGPALSASSRAMLDLEADIAAYPVFGAWSGSFSVAPRYVYGAGRWNVDLGVKFAFIARSSSDAVPVYSTVSPQIVYPDIRIGFEAVKEHLNVYLDVDGGDRITTFSELLRHDFRMDMHRSPSPLLGNELTRVDAAFGLEGSVASRLGYNLRAGFAQYANIFLDGVTRTPSGALAYAPGYSSCQMFYAALDLLWTSGPFSADGSFTYRGTDVPDGVDGLFSPAAFSGQVRLEYNWKRRVFVGADCSFSTARHTFLPSADGLTSVRLSIPSYADLGLSLEFRFSRSFSVWAHGGNLLDMAVQKTPLLAESGVNFTAGICLSLQ